MDLTHDDLGCEYYREPIARYKMYTDGSTIEKSDEELKEYPTYTVYKCGYCWKTWTEILED